MSEEITKQKLKHILVERLEELTRLNVSLERERTKANDKADRYYKWWQEDETKLAELEDKSTAQTKQITLLTEQLDEAGITIEATGYEKAIK